LAPLIDKFGAGILTKTISADQAASVKNLNKLSEDLKAGQDVEAVIGSIAANGGDQDKLSELSGQELELTNKMKGEIMKDINANIKQDVEAVCKIHQTLVEDEEQNTTIWLIKNKIAVDILITIEIEEWVSKALKAQVLNQATYTSKKRDMAN